MEERIIILQRILPHYRIGFFRKFCQRFPLTKILYGQAAESETLKSINADIEENFIQIRNTYLGQSGKTFYSKAYREISSYKPGIVITGLQLTSLNVYTLFIRKLYKNFKLILWSFGYDPFRGFDPVNNVKDKLRLKLYMKADAVIFYWKKGKEEIEKFTGVQKHFFVAPNTLDTDELIEIKNKFDNSGKDEIKKQMGIETEYHFVYAGRLIYDKQVDILLKAFRLVNIKNSDCSLSIIGDGPEKQNLISLSKKLELKNVEFRGEILDETEVGKWIYASDAFTMPGRLGLSVVHSFCFGTPVISQKKDTYYHGEGISYLENNFNGILTEDGSEESFASAMLKIISDKTFAGELRKNAFQTATGECSIENMLNGFEKAIEYLKR